MLHTLHISEPITSVHFRPYMSISIRRVPRPSSDTHLVGSPRAKESCDRPEITHRTNQLHDGRRASEFGVAVFPFSFFFLQTYRKQILSHTSTSAVMRIIGFGMDGKPRVCASLHNVGRCTHGWKATTHFAEMTSASVSVRVGIAASSGMSTISTT